MIKSSLTSLAGVFVAREVEKGTLPEMLSVPLTLLIARLPAPALLLGAAGYGAYRLVTASRTPRKAAPRAKAKPRPSRTRSAAAIAKR